MAPKGRSKGKGKVGATMPTSAINRRLSLDWDRIQGIISKHICGLIRIYNVSGIKDEMRWDLLHDIIFLDPVTTRHFPQLLLMWPHRRRRSSPFREWWAAFRSYMGQMFDNTCEQKNNWRWDNPRAFQDRVNRSNLQTTSSGQVKRTGERFSWYCSDDPWAKIEPPSCRQYEPGDILAVRPLNWDEILHEHGDYENWVDPGAPSGGSTRPGDGNDNEDSEGEEDTQGGEKGTVKGKRAKDGKGKGKASEVGERKGKGKGKGHSKGKGIVEQIPGGDDISRAIALWLQKEMSEADYDMEG